MIHSGFSSFADDPNATELDAALLVNGLLVENLDPVPIRSQLAELARRCDCTQAPWEFLRRQGFGVSQDIGQPPDNSRLDLVLERRMGLPITLAVLLMEVARATGAEACGINFPGHFLARVNGVLVDPLSMSATSEENWRAPAAGGLDRFPIATPVGVLIRMLNNLKQHHAASGRWDLALEVLDCQQLVSPRNTALTFERSELWLRLGALEMARVSLEEVAALAAVNEPEAAELARRRLKALANVQETSH